MKKLMLSTAALLLASGLTMAQTSTPQPDPNAAPSGAQTTPQPDPNAAPSGAQTTPSGTTTPQTDAGKPSDSNSFSGCLSGSKDNYVLTTDDGKTYRIHSDKDISENVGKRVEVSGTMKSDAGSMASGAAGTAAAGNAMD